MRRSQKSTACPELEQELVLYHYDELESAQRNRIQAHVVACQGCRHYLEELQSILSLAASADQPPQEFWTDYSRDLRRKLAELEERPSWWARLNSVVRPWAVPALAASGVIAIALIFTLGKGMMPDSEIPDQALIEALPVAEKLDFFTHMELLDSLELLEPGAANGEV